MPHSVRRIASLLLTVLALGYFARFLVQTLGRSDIPILLTWPALAAIIFVACATVANVGLASWAWHQLLGQDALPPRQLASIIGRSQIAKYLPGNIGHHLTRSALSVERGVPLRAVARSLAMEAALLAATGVGLAIVALPVLHPPWRRAVLAYTLSFILLGFGLAAVGFAIAHPTLSFVPLAVAAFAISWVGGFLVPGAPAGLGVREGILVAMLSPSVDRALPIVLGFRLGTTLGDLVSLGAAHLIASRIGPIDQNPSLSPADSE